jgi:hypothetical protein
VKGFNHLRTSLLIPIFMIGVHLPGIAAERERIVAQVQEREIMVQLQDLQAEAAYQLGLFDLGNGQLVQSVAIDKKDQGNTLNLPVALPDAGLYQLKLKKNGEWVSLEELPMVAVPKQGFRLLGGEIDRRNQKIHFTLSTSCIFRIVATNESQMNILTLQGWKFGSAGQKIEVPWDFWDGGKVKNYWSDPSLAVVADYIPLPEGFLVAGNPDFASHRGIPLLRGLQLPADEFKFDVSLRKGDLAKEKKMILKDQLPVIEVGDFVRVIVAPESLEILKGRRFEILYFLEGDFVHEETEGMSPSNYCLPNLGRPSGRYHLTVNIRDFNGNAGSSTVAFWYEAPHSENISNQ